MINLEAKHELLVKVVKESGVEINDSGVRNGCVGISFGDKIMYVIQPNLFNGELSSGAWDKTKEMAEAPISIKGGIEDDEIISDIKFLIENFCK